MQVKFPVEILVAIKVCEPRQGEKLEKKGRLGYPRNKLLVPGSKITYGNLPRRTPFVYCHPNDC